MPSCPGCKRHLSHEECLAHIRYCKWLWSSAPEQESEWGEQLMQELRDRER